MRSGTNTESVFTVTSLLAPFKQIFLRLVETSCRMKTSVIFLALGSLMALSACNTEKAEDAAKGYLSETLTDLRKQLPGELRTLDSMLLDSTLLKKKIAETTNIDSLEKYNELLKDAKNLIRKDISGLDSLSPEIKQVLEYHP